MTTTTLDAPPESSPSSHATAGNPDGGTPTPWPHDGIDPDAFDDATLASKLEPFDSYWQAPDDIDAGYDKFASYYQANVLPHLPPTPPEGEALPMLVVSCGPGYLVNLLKDRGYTDVIGIDSDPDKTAHAQKRGLDCRAERAFGFVKPYREHFAAIVLEQELNHLTHDEMIAMLRLCHRALKPGGTIYCYGLNGANPMVGAENLAHNIDHFNLFAEHSLQQVLQLGGFRDIRVLPMKLYVFWTNPLNYVGLAVTGIYELWCKVMFKLYGKNVKVLSKKIAATATR
jgi:SAM-dependent methyltransferase